MNNSALPLQWFLSMLAVQDSRIPSGKAICQSPKSLTSCDA